MMLEPFKDHPPSMLPRETRQSALIYFKKQHLSCKTEEFFVEKN